MNSEIFSKLNVYEQFGYLLVGAVLLLVIYFDSLLLNFPFPVFNFSSLIIWIVVAYFSGHLIQALANMIIKEKKGNFSEKQKELLKEAKKFFMEQGLSLNLSENEIWQLCYMLTTGKDPTGQIERFIAYYGLYRGWFLIFVLETLFLFGYTVYKFNLNSLSYFLVSGFITFLFFNRTTRFYSYTTDKVLQVFVLLIIFQEKR